MAKCLWSVLFAAVFLFAAWLRITSPPAPIRTPDEICYANFAGAAVAHPWTAAREQIRIFNSHPAQWNYPVPDRVAYYYSVAAVNALFHRPVMQSGVTLSTAASIVQLALVGLVGLRFFGRPAALAAMAMLSVCPQDLTMARRNWADGSCGCFAMLLLWLCMEIASRRRAWPWWTAFWICGAYFMLLKEACGFYFSFCVAGLAIHAWMRDHSWKPVVRIGAGGLLAAGLSFAFLAWLCGGLSPIAEAVRHVAQFQALGEYARQHQNGPWYSLPLGLWILSPLAAAGCAAAFAALILGGKLPRRELVIGMGALILLTLTLASLRMGLKNLRYVAFITGPWYLMAGLGLTWLAGLPRKTTGSIAAACFLTILVAASCWSDFRRFQEYFIHRDIQDLDIHNIATAPFG
ncbi:MAG TPA: glycosyltransferase family 39 protein [Chthoniobacteraceae bacterium]|jgi:HAMP domain-containing protein|nr:glycosyltransferase family 39 protein [Chthoniobacteraceae bacterium]